MSDTTSFLGGAALAGLAALIVMRGGITIGAPNLSSPQIPQFPQMSLGNNGITPGNSPLPLPPVTNPAPTNATVGRGGDSDYEKAKWDIKLESLKAQVEQQQAQLRSQQAVIDTLTAQLKTASIQPPQPVATAPVPQPMPSPSAADQATTSVISGLPWALGGMMLTFGGGIALVGMFTLLSRQNRPRTIEVVHDDYPLYLPPSAPTAATSSRRRVQVLPPRRAIKRVVEVDED